MQDFAAIDFEGYGMNIRCINFTACLPHHSDVLQQYWKLEPAPNVLSYSTY